MERSSTTLSDEFAEWIQGYGLRVDDQHFLADSDGDGLSNGLEGYFGTHPGVPNPGLTDLFVIGNSMSFQHPVNDTALSDLVARYEWSTDLVTWYAADGAETDGSNTVTAVVVTNSPSPDKTTVTLNISGAIPSKLFVRMVVKLQSSPE